MKTSKQKQTSVTFGDLVAAAYDISPNTKMAIKTIMATFQSQQAKFKNGKRPLFC